MRLKLPLMKQDGFLFRKGRLRMDYIKYHAKGNFGNYVNRVRFYIKWFLWHLPLDPKQVASFEEIIISQVIQQEAITRLLVEKGVFSK